MFWGLFHTNVFFESTTKNFDFRIHRNPYLLNFQSSSLSICMQKEVEKLFNIK